MKKVISKIGLITIATTFIVVCSVPAQAQINNYVKINITAGTYINVNGNLTNTATGIIQNNGKIILTGDFQNDGTFSSGGVSNVKLDGSTSQNIKGSVVTTFNNLTISGTSNKRLAKSAQVSDSLYFLANRLIIGNNDLVLLQGANISGTDSNKFIVTNGTGLLIKNSVPTSADFLFPVGDDTTKYKPITLNYTGTVDNFSVRVIKGLNPTTGNDNSCVQATYFVQETNAGGSTGTLKLGWNTKDEGGSFARANTRMLNYKAGTWQSIASTLGATANPPATDWYYQAAGITDFTTNASRFALNDHGGSCSNPSGITATFNPICNGSSTSLSVVGGSASCGKWMWYSGSCGGTYVGFGPTITVSPIITTDYYVRAEGSSPGDTTNCAFLTVTVIPTSLSTPGAISGNTFACIGNAYNYSIAPVPGASNYIWTVPAGWTINSGQGTISMNASPGGAAQNGDITVTASNSCGTSGTRTLAVTASPGTPVKPWIISGNIQPCIGASEVYTTTPVLNATLYTWSVPVGWSITAGQGNTSITVTAGTFGQNGNITVNAGNTCGTSTNYSVAVTVKQCNKTLNLKVFLEGLYAGGGTMNPATGSFDTLGYPIPQWTPTVADTIIVELHEDGDYSHIIYTAYNVQLNIDGTASVNVPGSYSGDYNITVKSRNHLETTSANTVSFAGASASYDFSVNIAKAYGYNMKNISGVSVIYAGDITQYGPLYDYPNPGIKDGVIDINDLFYTFYSYLNGDYGYVQSDITGDGVADITDVYMTFYNYLLGVFIATP